MIEVANELNSDDLWTEEGEPEMSAQNGNCKGDFDAIGTGIGEMYYAMRKKHVPRKYAFKMCVLMMQYLMTGGIV